jgi:hypothetical protein
MCVKHMCVACIWLYKSMREGEHLKLKWINTLPTELISRRHLKGWRFRVNTLY